MTYVMYHYTSPSNWKKINRGDPGALWLNPQTERWVEGSDIRGLWPCQRLIEEGPYSKLVPREATRPAIFGLPEQKPQSWISFSQEGESILSNLACYCVKEREAYELLCLKVQLTQEDSPLVVDYQKMLQLSLREEERRKDYWNSRVALSKYQGEHILPEIIVWNPIPLDRIQLVRRVDLELFLKEIEEERAQLSPNI